MMCLKDLKGDLENYSKKMTGIKSVIEDQDAGLNWESQKDTAAVMNKLQFFFLALYCSSQMQSQQDEYM